jgi:hypothetical protein
MKWFHHEPSDFDVGVKIHKLPIVYVIATRELDYIKIGKTKSLKQRLSNLQSGCPFHLHLWLGIRTSKADEIEKFLHKRYEEDNLRGEWFCLSTQQLDELAQFVNLTNINVREAIRALL